MELQECEAPTASVSAVVVRCEVCRRRRPAITAPALAVLFAADDWRGLAVERLDWRSAGIGDVTTWRAQRAMTKNPAGTRELLDELAAAAKEVRRITHALAVVADAVGDLGELNAADQCRFLEMAALVRRAPRTFGRQFGGRGIEVQDAALGATGNRPVELACRLCPAKPRTRSKSLRVEAARAAAVGRSSIYV